MGALVTVDLSGDLTAADLPWIVTLGPLGDDEDWEPVVCGPYEQRHAMALARALVVDDEYMAVVEPIRPYLSAGEIREAVGRAVAAGDAAAAGHDPMAVPDLGALAPGGTVPSWIAAGGPTPGWLAPGGSAPDRRVPGEAGAGEAGAGEAGAGEAGAYREGGDAPGPDEIRAGLARIAMLLLSAGGA